MKLSLFATPLVAVVWSSLLTVVSGATIDVAWSATNIGNFNANVGDVIRFTWSGTNHNVWREDSAACATAGGTVVSATATSGTYEYTFVSSDVGTVTWSCRVSGHCTAGQITTVTVSDGTTSSSPSPDPSCFSKDTTVNVLGKGSVPIKNVQVDEQIQIASGEYHPVYALGHYEPERQGRFVQLTTTSNNNNNKLEVTPDHMLYLQDTPEPVPAASVQVGDVLRTLSSSSSSDGGAKVTKISSVTKKGLYAPFTQDATLVVNGEYVASAYAILQKGNDHNKIQAGGVAMPFVTQHLAMHMGLSPLRMMCRYGAKSVCNPAELDGLHPFVKNWVNFLDWAQEQSAIVQWPLFAVVVFALCLIYSMECMLGQPGLMMVAGGMTVMVAFHKTFRVHVDKKKVV